MEIAGLRRACVSRMTVEALSYGALHYCFLCLSLTEVKCRMSRVGPLRAAHRCACGCSRTRPSPLPLPFSHREDKQKLHSWCVLTTATNSGESNLPLEQNLQYAVSSLRKRQLIRILKNSTTLCIQREEMCCSNCHSTFL